ncbi:MAG: helix-turn-helix transcriptional regulator [Lachnospiraceae bacterium]|nr:helix-turn-helix transcriptional regulator [Lachnospiraceae bacterium]
MDHPLFTSLLQSLLQISVASFSDEEREAVLADFAAKYCYDAALQPAFTAAGLSEAICLLPASAVFELQDHLGIRLLLLQADGRTYLIGPFVISGFDENRIRGTLIAFGLPASFLPALRLYYTAFPQLSRQSSFHTLQGLLRVFCPEAGEYAYRTYNGPVAVKEKNADAYNIRFDYETVYKRYELENRFLNAIEEGDTAHVLDAFSGMEISDVNNVRYIDAVYSRPDISFAIIRALSRKAAERGGAPLMEINEITQRTVQGTAASSSPQTATRRIQNMILELTEAVRRHKAEDGRYSSPVRKVMSYLRFNYSQELSLAQLAGIAAMAPNYLSKQFKEETGRTISDTIRQLRCGQAARLLRETDTPIAEISAYVGYPDSNYFIKVFKKTLGMTPSEYRKTR